jgi:hypothetical protein
MPSHIDLITPDTTKAVEAAVGATVNLSAVLRNQNGSAATAGTFNWSVVESGATLSATSGASTTFSATTPGIYTVNVCDSRWPNQFEDELVFVGSLVGARSMPANNCMPPSLKVFQTPQGLVVTSGIAGKLSIVSLQGRMICSMNLAKPGSIVLKTDGFARGAYLMQISGGSDIVRKEFFIQ